MGRVIILNSWDSQGNQVTDSIGIYPTIRGCGGAGYQQGYLLDRRGNNGESSSLPSRHDCESEVIYVLATQQGGAEITDGKICPTITSAARTSGNNQPCVVLRKD